MTKPNDPIRVPAAKLEPGDRFPDGDEITAVYHDLEGTWVETHRGDCGYMTGTHLIYR
jgi:hypothetical protein